MHPFTLDSLPRVHAQAHIERYYEKFSDLQSQGLDALIIGVQTHSKHS